MIDHRDIKGRATRRSAADIRKINSLENRLEYAEKTAADRLKLTQNIQEQKFRLVRFLEDLRDRPWPWWRRMFFPGLKWEIEQMLNTIGPATAPTPAELRWGSPNKS